MKNNNIYLQLNHSVKNKSLEAVQFSSSALSIFVSAAEVSYTLTHLPSNTITTLKAYKLKNINTHADFLGALEQFFETEDILKQPFAAINVGIKATKYCLVPQNYFLPEQAELILQAQIPLTNEEVVLYDPVNNSNSIVVYALNKNIIHIFKNNLYNNVNIQHTVSFLLNAIPQHLTQPNALYAYLQKTHVDITIIKNGELQLCNIFKAEVADDLIYNILNCLQQANVPADTKVMLFGDFNIDQAYFRKVQQYVSYLEVGKRPYFSNYCPEMEAIPENAHFLLFCIKK